jgi:hypothetical protein
VIRWIQLLDSAKQVTSRRAATVRTRIREGLLRDNKVIPLVLGVLALLIFAWLIASFLIEDPGEEETSKGASLSQAPEDSESISPETLTPEVESRDTDSFAVFESKDPFREIVSKANETTNGSSADSDGGDRSTGEGDRDTDRNRDEDEDLIDQSFPSEPGSGERSTGGGEFGGGGPGPGGGAAAQGGGAGQNGNGNLFNSGGDLPP